MPTDIIDVLYNIYGMHLTWWNGVSFPETSHESEMLFATAVGLLGWILLSLWGAPSKWHEDMWSQRNNRQLSWKCPHLTILSSTPSCRPSMAHFQTGHRLRPLAASELWVLPTLQQQRLLWLTTLRRSPHKQWPLLEHWRQFCCSWLGSLATLTPKGPSMQPGLSQRPRWDFWPYLGHSQTVDFAPARWQSGISHYQLFQRYAEQLLSITLPSVDTLRRLLSTETSSSFIAHVPHAIQQLLGGIISKSPNVCHRLFQSAKVAMDCIFGIALISNINTQNSHIWKELH